MPQRQRALRAEDYKEGNRSVSWQFQLSTGPPEKAVRSTGQDSGAQQCGEHPMYFDGISPGRSTHQLLPGARTLIYVVQDFNYLPSSCLKFSIISNF